MNLVPSVVELKAVVALESCITLFSGAEVPISDVVLLPTLSRGGVLLDNRILPTITVCHLSVYSLAR